MPCVRGTGQASGVGGHLERAGRGGRPWGAKGRGPRPAQRSPLRRVSLGSPLRLLCVLGGQRRNRWRRLSWQCCRAAGCTGGRGTAVGAPLAVARRAGPAAPGCAAGERGTPSSCRATQDRAAPVPAAVGSPPPRTGCLNAIGVHDGPAPPDPAAASARRATPWWHRQWARACGAGSLCAGRGRC